MQGGIVDGGQDSGTASVTATGAEGREPARSTATDGGQPQPDPEPRNIVAGAIAGTDWTHDDVTVALSFVSTVAIVLWLLLEVTNE